MHLIYLDESGNTGERKDPDQPLHLIGALIVHESKIRAIENAIDAVTFEHFLDVFHEPGFEWHGTQLFKGDGCFKGIAPAVRIQAIYDLLKVLEDNDAKVGWAAANKMKMTSSWHPHRLAFVLLMERVELHLRHIDALGLLVADENKEVEQRLIDDLDVYKRGTTGFGWRPIRIKQIVDSVHFVQSKNNRLIQAVDVVAYFALRARRLKDRLLASYTAQPEPRGAWPAWIDSSTNASEKAVLEIAKKIEGLTIFTKIFPA